MAKNKTTETENSVTDYIAAIADEKRRNDCAAIIDLVTKQTGIKAKMWGPGIVGFGNYHYKYESGHEGDAPRAGLASRSNAITLYLGNAFDNREELLAKFGKHKTGKSCVYIQKLEDISTDVLSTMFKNAIAHSLKQYPEL
jgi:hypothetical protein